jgi:hypothetical protein
MRTHHFEHKSRGEEAQRRVREEIRGVIVRRKFWEPHTLFPPLLSGGSVF